MPAPPRWMPWASVRAWGVMLVGGMGGRWMGAGREGRGERGETYAGGVGPVALVAEGPLADDFAVRVGFLVAVDVAGS